MNYTCFRCHNTVENPVETEDGEYICLDCYMAIQETIMTTKEAND